MILFCLNYTFNLMPRSLMNRAASWRSVSSLSLDTPSCRDGENSILSRPNIQRESAFSTAGATVVVVELVAAAAVAVTVVVFVAVAWLDAVVAVVDTETTVLIEVTVWLIELGACRSPRCWPVRLPFVLCAIIISDFENCCKSMDVKQIGINKKCQ